MCGFFLFFASQDQAASPPEACWETAPTTPEEELCCPSREKSSSPGKTPTQPAASFNPSLDSHFCCYAFSEHGLLNREKLCIQLEQRLKTFQLL